MATTQGGLPYPIGTDKVVDGDDAIAALATATDTAMLNGSGRARASVLASGYAQNLWLALPLDVVVEGSKGPRWTFANRAFTITRAGVYLLTGAATMSVGNYVIRLRDQANNVSLAMVGVGTVSFSGTTSAARYLPVGARVALEVFPTVAAAQSPADGPDAPVTLTIAALPYVAGP